MNKVVLDYRYRNHLLVAETNEAVFVYDEARDKVTRWLKLSKNQHYKGTLTGLNFVTVYDAGLS